MSVSQSGGAIPTYGKNGILARPALLSSLRAPLIPEREALPVWITSHSPSTYFVQTSELASLVYASCHP